MHVVPGYMVQILAPALSNDANTGAVIAEQLLRAEESSDIILELCNEPVGKKVGNRALQLAPLMPGSSWDVLADQLRAKVKEMI